jgi:hypothetical protein
MVPRIRRGDYGLVQVVEGQYAGRVGYYDGDEGPFAFVHFYGLYIVLCPDQAELAVPDQDDFVGADTAAGLHGG